MDILSFRLQRVGQVQRFLFGIMTLLLLSPCAMGQLSPGDLSEPHKSLEGISNCTKCHELGEGPSADKCLACHKLTRQQLTEGHGFHHQPVNIDRQSCVECHNEHAGRDFALVHWPKGKESFDHSQTGFILEGKHASVPCRDCHNPALIREDLAATEPSKDLTRTFMGLGTDCLSCHDDQHRGQLGDNCLNCHANESFKQAPGFDHANTRFALTGRHSTVDCAKCHPTIIDTKSSSATSSGLVKYKGIRFETCANCHQDKHQSRFGLDCTRCHQTSGWNDVKMGSFDHRKTDFPLIGLHSSLACEKCHKAGVYDRPIAHGECGDCHTDVHRGQFTDRADGGRCNACHNEHGFMPALFAVSDHQKTDFPLVGAHLAQPCQKCHEEATTADGSHYRVFDVAHETCTTCHQDQHAGQFFSNGPKKLCTDCHNNSNWQQVDFDHDTDASFKLVGAHKTVPCASCHKPETIDQSETTRYRPLPQRCVDCHRPGTLSSESL